MVWSVRRWALFGILGGAAIAAVIWTPPSIDRYSALQQAKIRSVLSQSGVPQVDGLAYFGTDNTPAPVEGVVEPMDINDLLRDFPTAAGAIKQKVSADAQYHAAMAGDHDRAMRLMAESFLTGEGSGSYRAQW
ncbi:hypothetical protein [Ferrimonas pelagia]|uniref:DUF1318 domain-containing protein n=1 Tax=Ferrimonas pelagia TaxID=1177826 RepID=A0ABP9EA06_9GAMM